MPTAQCPVTPGGGHVWVTYEDKNGRWTACQNCQQRQ